MTPGTERRLESQDPVIRRLSYLCFQATQQGQASHAHVHEIIAGLERCGWKVQLFEPDYATKQRCPGIVGKLWAFSKMQLLLWTSHVPADVLYVRSHYAALPSLLWARWRHIPVVMEVNGVYEDAVVAYPWLRAVRAPLKYLGRCCAQLANAIIGVTPQHGDWLRRECGNKPVYVIPNGANTDVFHPDATCDELLTKPYVVWIGALARFQGIDTALHAVQRPEWPPQVAFVIVGDGTERHVVENAATNSAQKVIYLGRKPYREIPGILTGSLAALTMTNNSRGISDIGCSPLKLYEALACGKPVVVTDLPGQTELVLDQQCGIVIPVDDAAALSRAVAYLYAHPEIAAQMGSRGRLAVEREHSWRRRAETTDRILRSLAENL